MPAKDAPEGELFSRVYMRPSILVSDSERMRKRLAAIIEARVLRKTSLAKSIERRLGVRVPNGYQSHLWGSWLAKCDLRDLLDTITLAAEAVQQEKVSARVLFVAEVARVFDEEGLHYRVDDRGGVHYRVDEEFERQIVHTLAGLEAPGLAAVRAGVDKAIEALQLATPDGKTAIQQVFEATEVLFRLSYRKRPRLTSAFAGEDLTPLLEALYSENAAALGGAKNTLRSFGGWIDSCHFYRHGQGEVEPKQAPIGYAVLLVSQGLSFIRWLTEITPRGNAPAHGRRNNRQPAGFP